MSTCIEGETEALRAVALGQSALPGAELWLRWAVRAWFAVAIAGQWIFAGYITAVYWRPVARGESERWLNLFSDFNLAFMAHVGLAVVVFVAGPLQMIAQVRTRLPRLHRWNGRAFLVSVAIAMGSGLYLIWMRGTVGGIGVQIGTSISAFLAFYFGWQAVSCARAGAIPAHRRYALRLWLTAGAVWYFRIQLMVWLMLSGGRGLDPETFEGPALVIISFTQYLVPLLVLEWYFRVQATSSNTGKAVFSAALVLLTLLMALGIYAASVGLWLARI